jgi:hypothetical protein
MGIKRSDVNTENRGGTDFEAIIYPLILGKQKFIIPEVV